MYLHYKLKTETLELELDRTNHRARVAEYRANFIKDELRYARGAKAQELKRGYHLEISRAQRHARHVESIEEELKWREDPEGLTKFYQEHGYKLVYLCGWYEFDTVDEALAEARTLHTINDVHLELGPDGSYVEDLVPPEEMVQVAFVERSNR